MKKSIRILALLLSIVMVLGVFAGCSKSSTPEDKETEATKESVEMVGKTTGNIEGKEATEPVDKVRIALTGASFDVSPFGNPSGARDWFVSNMYASLFFAPHFGATLEELEPWVADSITKVDDVTYTIKLNENVYDNQGNHITADDVIFSYDKMFTISQIAQIGTDLEALEKVNDFELTMRLVKAGVEIVENLIAYNRMSIVDKEWYENATDEERTNNPAVTGAYAIKKYVPGSSLILEAVDNYWQPVENRCGAAIQNVKEIEYTVITEAAMRSIALENNEIDVTQITATELKRFYENGAAKEGWNVLINGGNRFNVLLLNMDPNSDSPLAHDINLRKAVLYGISSEDFMYATGNTEDTAKICYTMANDTYAGYNPDWEEDYWSYDLEKAQECYAASGYKPGEVEITFMVRNTTGDGAIAYMVAALEAVGFKVDLLTVDQALSNTYRTDSSKWDIMIDSKGTGSHVARMWDEMFNPVAYTNGSVCFNHDDKLVELLNEASSKGDQASCDAFHYYLIELACCKGLDSSLKFTVGQDGILQLTPSSCFNPLVNAYVFAEDYQSHSK